MMVGHGTDPIKQTMLVTVMCIKKWLGMLVSVRRPLRGHMEVGDAKSRSAALGHVETATNGTGYRTT